MLVTFFKGWLVSVNVECFHLRHSCPSLICVLINVVPIPLHVGIQQMREINYTVWMHTLQDGIALMLCV